MLCKCDLEGTHKGRQALAESACLLYRLGRQTQVTNLFELDYSHIK